MSNNLGNKIIKSLISVSGIIMISKILGLIRQIVTASAFGTTVETDIISLSEGVISNLEYLLIQSLSTAFLPIYIQLKSESGREASGFVTNTVKLFLIITTVLSSLFIFLSKVLAKIIAPSYSVEMSNKLSQYICIVAPTLIIIVLIAIFNSLLKANECFIPGELVGFNQSLIVIILVLLVGNKFSVNSLIIALYAYSLINLTYLLFCSRKYWNTQHSDGLIDSNTLRLLKMMLPLLMGYSLIFVNQQVDKIVVSGFEEGAVTALAYASSLSAFVCTFSGSVCGVLYTYITQKMVEGQTEEATQIVLKTSTQITTILIPISIIAIMNSKDIVTLVFNRGHFDSNSVTNCSMALVGYSCMFIPYFFREFFARIQYAHGDSKQPMINSSLAILFNIILSIYLGRLIGILGVSLATSISMLIAAVLNIICSQKRFVSLKSCNFFKIVCLWCLGSLANVVIVAFLKNLMKDLPPIFRLTIISIIVFAVFLSINKSVIDTRITSILKMKALRQKDTTYYPK